MQMAVRQQYKSFNRVTKWSVECSALLIFAICIENCCLLSQAASCPLSFSSVMQPSGVEDASSSRSVVSLSEDESTRGVSISSETRLTDTPKAVAARRSRGNGNGLGRVEFLWRGFPKGDTPSCVYIPLWSIKMFDGAKRRKNFHYARLHFKSHSAPCR